MKLVLLGAPGSGKGTISNPLSKKLGIPCISTGEIFRQNIREKTQLGKIVAGYLENGELVPDDVTNAIIEDRIMQPDCKNGFILDGYPRTIEQAKTFDKSLKKRGERLDAVINLEVDDDVVIKRLASRRVCSNCGKIYNTRDNMPAIDDICDKCGGKVVLRDDDNEETVAKRLVTYYKKSRQLVDYYKKSGLLMNIDGRPKSEESVRTIVDALFKA